MQVAKMENTLTRIHRPAKDVIKRFAEIHGKTLPQFFDDLANCLVLGIDGLTSWDLATLRREYRYSDILVCADARLELEENEKAMLTIKNTEEKFETYAPYPLEPSSPLKLLAKDNFDYNLEIFVTDNETIIGSYNTKWTVTKTQLELGKNITFHIIEKDFKDDEERYLFFARLKEHSKKVPLPEIR